MNLFTLEKKKGELGQEDTHTDTHTQLLPKHQTYRASKGSKEEDKGRVRERVTSDVESEHENREYID